MSARIIKSLLAASVLSVATAQAQTSVGAHGAEYHGSVIGDDVLYAIGGGRAVSMSRAADMRSIGVGIGWNSNLICGDLSISTTIRNQLNGLTNGFQQIMSGIIQNATAAVASLPALIIQRADPGLYNLLTNGVLQGRMDFDRSKLTCRAIADRMADAAAGQLGWDQLSEGTVLKQSTSSNDAVAAVERAEANRGNAGVPWVGGVTAGGANQPPVRIVRDVTRAGYNLLAGRDVNDASMIAPSNCNGNEVCSAWYSPDQAATWATRVIGEREQRTCESCVKTVTTPGFGLTPLIQTEFQGKLELLQALIAGVRPLSPSELQNVGSASLPVTRGVIEALRDDPDQDILARRLVSEAALSSVMEKALLLQRTLVTGSQEPNVAANQMAQAAVLQQVDLLDRQINNLKTELELRRALTSNTAAMIIQRQQARNAASRGVFEGDATRNRVDELQRPPPRRR